MGNLQVFKNQKFGEIRTIIDDDSTILFVAVDVAKPLGYSNTTDAINRHCRWVVKRDIPHPQNPAKTIEVNAIPEGDVYRLVSNSELPNAREFESLIFDEILPSIRKTGAYITNNADPGMLRAKADEIESMSALNEAAKIILPVLEEAGLKPQYRAIALRQIYRKGGMDLPIEEMKAERELFDLTAIAKAAQIYSANDRPHGQAVGAIIRQLDINDDEKELVTFEKNGHSGTAFQYTESVIEKVRNWIESNGYPCIITTIDRTGKDKKFTVSYKKKQDIKW
jgi:prophage antirepressor-like protein